MKHFYEQKSIFAVSLFIFNVFIFHKYSVEKKIFVEKGQKRPSLRAWNLNAENAPYFSSVSDHPITEKIRNDE